MVILGIMLSWKHKKRFFFYTEILNLHITYMDIVAILRNKYDFKAPFTSMCLYVKHNSVNQNIPD